MSRRRRLFFISVLLPSLLVPSAAAAAFAPEGHDASEVRRVLTLLNVAAEEYREGVVDGRVVLPVEYREAGMFLDEAEMRLRSVAGADAGRFDTAFAALRRDLAEKRPLDQVRGRIAALRERISEHSGVRERVFPDRSPSAARGRVLFRENCVSCHGENADGRGVDAAKLQPPPADFTDPAFMRMETPFDFFHIITVGKPTAAMPAWGDVFSVEDRWDLVAYLWTVRPGRGGLAEGQGVYLTQCASCHGATGDGRGAYSASLLTAAAKLDAPGALVRKSDRDLFRSVADGIEDTPMPAFAGRLDDEEIWSALAFVRSLSLGGGSGEPPAAAGGPGSGRRFAGLLRLLAEDYQRAVPADADRNELEYAESLLLLEQVRRRTDSVAGEIEATSPSDAEKLRGQIARLGEAIERGEAPASVGELALAMARRVEGFFPEAPTGSQDAGPLAETRRLLGESLEAYGRDDPRALYLASDAYFAFEPAERQIGLTHPDLVTRIESRFVELRGILSKPGNADAVRAVVAAIEADLASANPTQEPAASPLALAFQSGTIILREGFEVVLIIGALLAYVMKSGNASMRRPILWGTGAGVAASLATAYVLVELLRASGAAVELLEGAAMLLATAVLFFVSYWLISKAEADKWQRYIQGKVKVALARGSGLALAGAAFLAVYREGVETVLFYQALIVSADHLAPVGIGFAVGAVLLAVAYVAFMRVGRRIPIRSFFLGTSCLLYYLAFVFAGKGVRELQAAGVIGVTPIAGFPTIDFFGVYPTVQTLLLQAVLLVCLLYALFVALRPRFRRSPDVDLLAEVERLRRVAIEIRREIARRDQAGGEAAARHADSLIDHASELESQMSQRSGNVGAKA